MPNHPAFSRDFSLQPRTRREPDPGSILRSLMQQRRNMQERFKFTNARLERVTCPNGKQRATFQDDARPELILQVTSKGAKSYYCRCWNSTKGYTDKLYLGRLGQLSLEDARRRAREIAARADQGEEPVTRRRSLRQTTTFAEAYASFIQAPTSRRKKGPRREATIRTYEKQYRCHLADRFGSKRLSALRRTELDDFHSEIGNRCGRYAANRLLTMISGVFSDAITKGWKGSNPAQGIERFSEQPRQRFLEEHEVGAFIAACLEQSNAFADVALLALFTGLRRKNVCSASWSHIDLERAIWAIPADESKNGLPQVIYLSRLVRELLATRYFNRTDECWVFPGKGRTGHLVEPQRGVLRIAAQAGIDPKGVNMHCLRHTFISYADDLGLPSAVRKRLASHKGHGDMTARYTHARERRVREAYEQVAQHLLGFVGESQQILSDRTHDSLSLDVVAA